MTNEQFKKMLNTLNAEAIKSLMQRCGQMSKEQFNEELKLLKIELMKSYLQKCTRKQLAVYIVMKLVEKGFIPEERMHAQVRYRLYGCSPLRPYKWDELYSEAVRRLEEA